MNSNEEDIPRAVPLQSEFIENPIAKPSVPEVSIVEDKSKELIGKFIWSIKQQTDGAKPKESIKESIKQSSDKIPEQKSYTNNEKVQQFHQIPLSQVKATNSRHVRPHSFPPTDNFQSHKIPQFSKISFSSSNILQSQYNMKHEIQQLSDKIVNNIKTHEKTINNLKEIIEKLANELLEIKINQTIESQKIDKIIEELKLHRKYSDKEIQCDLRSDIRMKNLKEIQKFKGPIEKNSLQIICEERHDEEEEQPLPKSLINSIQNRIVKSPKKIIQEPGAKGYEILQKIPPSKDVVDELTVKYVTPKQFEWELDLYKWSGPSDVSVATHRYMEKYGLNCPVLEKKDENQISKTLQPIQKNNGSENILNAELIKKQPKFL